MAGRATSADQVISAERVSTADQAISAELASVIRGATATTVSPTSPGAPDIDEGGPILEGRHTEGRAPTAAKPHHRDGQRGCAVHRRAEAAALQASKADTAAGTSLMPEGLAQEDALHP